MGVLQCVVVLYGKDAESSETLRSLQSVCSQNAGLLHELAVLVYDNSAQPHDVLNLLNQFGSSEYVHNPENPGLAAAYNAALERAENCGSHWLLLLDQDTHLTRSFFEELLHVLEEDIPEKVGAIVPKLIQGQAVLSPQAVGRWNRKSVAINVCGIFPSRVTAFNTCACVRTSGIDAIGGFPADYPLDYLDHALFFRLQESGQQIYILNSRLQHHLSLLNMEEEMQPSRYRHVLDAEWRFVLATGEGGGKLMHRLRLLKRAAKQMGLPDKSYASLTWKAATNKR